MAPELVVILDGYRPDHPANELPSFRELLTRARQLKAVLILLTDARDLEPSHIDARLTVPERGAGVGEWARAIGAGVPERASGGFASHVLDVMLSIEGACTAGERVLVGSTTDVPPPLPADWDPYARTL